MFARGCSDHCPTAPRAELEHDSPHGPDDCRCEQIGCRPVNFVDHQNAQNKGDVVYLVLG